MARRDGGSIESCCPSSSDVFPRAQRISPASFHQTSPDFSVFPKGFPVLRTRGMSWWVLVALLYYAMSLGMLWACCFRRAQKQGEAHVLLAAKRNRSTANSMTAGQFRQGSLTRALVEFLLREGVPRSAHICYAKGNATGPWLTCRTKILSKATSKRPLFGAPEQ